MGHVSLHDQNHPKDALQSRYELKSYALVDWRRKHNKNHDIHLEICVCVQTIRRMGPGSPEDQKNPVSEWA